MNGHILDVTRGGLFACSDLTVCKSFVTGSLLRKSLNLKGVMVGSSCSGNLASYTCFATGRVVYHFNLLRVVAC